MQIDINPTLYGQLLQYALKYNFSIEDIVETFLEEYLFQIQ